MISVAARLALLIFLFAAQGAAAMQQQSQGTPAKAAHRVDIARMTADGGVMITSNAAYQEEDGGLTDYGQYFEALPGGLSARGCLWGERDGEVVGVFWHFLSGWDPEAQMGFLYQSAPGSTAFGHGGALGDDGHWSVQRFEGPGLPPLIRHENHWPSPDTVVTRTFNGDGDGEWEPRREYVWVRQPERTPPC